MPGLTMVTLNVQPPPPSVVPQQPRADTPRTYPALLCHQNNPLVSVPPEVMAMPAVDLIALPVAQEVNPNLFIGSLASGLNLAFLAGNSITHVVNLAAGDRTDNVMDTIRQYVCISWLARVVTNAQ